MPRHLRIALPLVCVLAGIGLRAAAPRTWQAALAAASEVTPHGAAASVVAHDGKRALRLIGERGHRGEAYAVVSGPLLRDGAIEIDLAGRPEDGASDTARGFVGVAFRMRADRSAFECFYLRPTNGRADDQLRRNHSTQYISFPDFPWERLRQQTPGVYESYVDLVSGEWTHVRVEFHDRRAALYVNRAPQPALIVTDLKLTPEAGAVGLWIGDETEAFFRDVRVVEK